MAAAVPFSQVGRKGIVKHVTSATTKTGHTLVYILAGVGALMLIAIIRGVAQG